MKKVFLAALLAASTAGAQIWTVEGPFKDEFLGCVRISTGQVQCSLKSSYIGSGAVYSGATYNASDSAAYAPDRKRYIASRSSIGGRDVTRGSVNVSKAAPVTVDYVFDYPQNFDKISLLFLDTGMLKDVPIKGSAPVAAPAPVQPARPAQAAPAGNVSLNAFDIKLTGCTPNKQGGYSCSQAELLPRR